MLNDYKSNVDELDLRYRLKMKMDIKTGNEIKKLNFLGEHKNDLYYLK